MGSILTGEAEDDDIVLLYGDIEVIRDPTQIACCLDLF